MRSPTALQTAKPMQFVADDHALDVDGSSLRITTDPDIAAKAIAAETLDRIRVVLDSYPADPIVLLSGGVDSILVAATAVAIGAAPRAITIVVDGETVDRAPAIAAAEALGLRHEVVVLSSSDVVSLAKSAVAALGVNELWEVAAAIPILAASELIRRFSAASPAPAAVLTGSGADAIFAGGRVIEHPIESAAANQALDEVVRTETGTNFVRDRLVPDFYERLLGDDAQALIHVFQTERFWQLAEQLAPPALFGHVVGAAHDKLAVRLACERLLPETAQHLAWTRKSPIQRSSGLFDALADAARARAAQLPGATTYSNPLTESMESVAVRLFLAGLD